jgi:hypothetical protein
VLRQKVLLGRKRVIRASELAQYGYCRKAWWLGSVEGIASSNVEALVRGTRAHRAHGQAAWWARALPVIAALLFFIAVLILVASLFS